MSAHPSIATQRPGARNFAARTSGRSTPSLALIMASYPPPWGSSQPDGPLPRESFGPAWPYHILAVPASGTGNAGAIGHRVSAPGPAGRTAPRSREDREGQARGLPGARDGPGRSPRWHSDGAAPARPAAGGQRGEVGRVPAGGGPGRSAGSRADAPGPGRRGRGGLRQLSTTRDVRIHVTSGRSRPGRVRARRAGRPGRGRTPAARRPRSGRTRVARTRPTPDRPADSLPPPPTTVPAIRRPVGPRVTGRSGSGRRAR